jgi:hypothetical protein
MQQSADRPFLTPVKGSGPENLRPLIVVVVALVVIAVLKPWGGGAPSRATSSGAAASPTAGGPAAIALAPSPPGRSPDPNSISCLRPIGWRLVTLQRSADRETRTWLVVTSAAATGPGDGTISVARLTENDVVGIGFCADGRLSQAEAAATPPSPASDVATTAWAGDWTSPTPASSFAEARITNVWRRNTGGAWMPVSFTALAPARGDTPNIEDARLYAPPGPPPESGLASRGAIQVVWPPGSYVFLVQLGASSSVLRAWFRLDLVWPPVADPPRSSPGARPSEFETPGISPVPHITRD